MSTQTFLVIGPTRREMLKVAMAAVAVAATADAAAGAQTAGGKIKAIGFDAFTIFDFRSIVAAFEENFPGKAKEIAATWRTRLSNIPGSVPSIGTTPTWSKSRKTP